MSSLTQPIQGMSDITGGEVRLWQWMEARARDVMARYGFEELRTPLMEHEGLFVRSIGDTTDVVQKEMYVFEKGGRRFCLRPEGTAGVMRHAAGLGPQETDGARWFYIGPMFRCERPQAGRKRQFHQCGVECLEEASPVVDAEILALQMDLFEAWGLKGLTIHLNTRGAAADHAPAAEALRAALAPHVGELCEDCQRRISQNVLRVLDCKNETCKAVVAGLPPLTELLSEESRAYLAAVAGHLEAMGVPYELDPLLVRGLDYYEHTIWEIVGNATGSQSALAGGGRYRIELGGRTLAGVGFAIGMERVAAALEAAGLAAEHELGGAPDAWLVGLGDDAVRANLALMRELRAAGVTCRMAPGGSMKSQMRAANKSGARFAVIRGGDEMAAGAAQLKNMVSGEQRTVATGELPVLLKQATSDV